MRCILVFPATSKHFAGDYKYTIGTGAPLCIALLGAVLENARIAVEVFDFQVPGTTVENLINTIGPDVLFVGFSFATLSAKNAFTLIGAVRAAKPATPIVIGGPHPTAMGAASLDECKADIVVFGEGETTVLQLAGALRDGGGISDVRGIARRDNGRLVTAAPQMPIPDLDTIPFAAFHLFDLRRYIPPAGVTRYSPWFPMVTSRGCPFDCVFCNKTLWGYRVRFRSAENVFEEIQRLCRDFGAKELAFFDDTFTLKHERVAALCEIIIAGNIRVAWRCSSRVDCVDEELLRLMKRAGCYSIGYGIESGNPHILEASCKGITMDAVRRGVSLTHRVGIETRGYFVLNLPGDTRETMEETVRFALSLDLTIANFTIGQPMVGTRFREIVESDPNFHVVAERWNDWDAYSDKEVLYTQGDISPNEVQRIYSRAYFRFYFRPRFIAKALLRIASFSQLKGYFRAALGFANAALRRI